MSQQPANTLFLILTLSIPVSCPTSEAPGGFKEVFPSCMLFSGYKRLNHFVTFIQMLKRTLSACWPPVTETWERQLYTSDGGCVLLEGTTPTWAITFENRSLLCHRAAFQCTIIQLKSTQFRTNAHRHIGYMSCWYTVSAGSEQPNPPIFPVGFRTIQNWEMWYKSTALYCTNWLGWHRADKTAETTGWG